MSESSKINSDHVIPIYLGWPALRHSKSAFPFLKINLLIEAILLLWNTKKYALDMLQRGGGVWNPYLVFIGIPMPEFFGRETNFKDFKSFSIHFLEWRGHNSSRTPFVNSIVFCRRGCWQHPAHASQIDWFWFALVFEEGTDDGFAWWMTCLPVLPEDRRRPTRVSEWIRSKRSLRVHRVE